MGAYLSWRVGRLAKRCFRPGNPEQQFTRKHGAGRNTKGGGLAVRSGGTGTGATGQTWGPAETDYRRGRVPLAYKYAKRD